MIDLRFSAQNYIIYLKIRFPFGIVKVLAARFAPLRGPIEPKIPSHSLRKGIGIVLIGILPSVARRHKLLDLSEILTVAARHHFQAVSLVAIAFQYYLKTADSDRYGIFILNPAGDLRPYSALGINVYTLAFRHRLRDIADCHHRPFLYGIALYRHSIYRDILIKSLIGLRLRQ